MKKTNKRVISLLLAVLMLVGVATVATLVVSADDGSTDTSSTSASTTESTTASYTSEYSYEVAYKNGVAVDDYHYKVEKQYDKETGALINTVKSQEEHTYDASTGACISCGYVHDCDTLGHILDKTCIVDFDDQYHYIKCPACGTTISVEHSYDRAGQDLGYSNDSDTVEDVANGHHWIDCGDCDYQLNYGRHSDTDLNYIDDNGNKTTDGLCDTCGIEMSHRWKRTANVTPTCTSRGSNTYMCINCSETYTETLPALGHDWSDSDNVNYTDTWIIDSNNNYKCTLTFTCNHAGCGSTMSYDVYYGGKDYDNVIVLYSDLDLLKDADDADAAINATIDEYKSLYKDVAPTCTTAGKSYYFAKFTVSDIKGEGWYGWENNDDGTFSYIAVHAVDLPALGHNFEEYVADTGYTVCGGGTKTAKCTREGCSITDTKTYEGDGNHVYTETVVAPTCSNQGYTLKKCDVCGYELKSNYTDTVDHTYGAKVTVAPTCTEQGYDAVTCSVCGAVSKSNYTAALGHDYTVISINEAGTIETCRCSRCNNVITQTHVHSYDIYTTSGHQCVCGKEVDHTDADYNFVCDYCGTSINFLDHWAHYIVGWPSYHSGRIIVTLMTLLSNAVKTLMAGAI